MCENTGVVAPKYAGSKIIVRKYKAIYESESCQLFSRKHRTPSSEKERLDCK
jgi:hypothetical protein